MDELDPLKPEWMEQARCAGVNPDLFHPDPKDELGIARCKAECARCPVNELCLDHALATDQPQGVWGGLTRAERWALHAPTRRICPVCRTIWWAVNEWGGVAIYCSDECRVTARNEVRMQYQRRVRNASTPLPTKEAFG